MKTRIIFYAVCAATALFSGCKDSSDEIDIDKEAVAFGYKGSDQYAEENYFITTPAVTNYLPARVLRVSEKYEITSNELALINSAGLIISCDDLTAIPDGYVPREKEPWFTTWVKKTTAFGIDGTSGFIAHFDEDKKIWKTGETFFSSYYDSKSEALNALTNIKSRVMADYSPKKIYDFEDSWIAEYLPLRVACVVGQKADGSWACMLNIHDKQRVGCGEWMPVEQQEERLKEYNHVKKMKAWREVQNKIIAENHNLVEAKRKEKGLVLFGENTSWTVDLQRGFNFAANEGSEEKNASLDNASRFNSKLSALSKDFAVEFKVENTNIITAEYGVVYYAVGEGDLYQVHCDMLFTPASTNEVDNLDQYRIYAIEKFQDGLAVPPPPAK